MSRVKVNNETVDPRTLPGGSLSASRDLTARIDWLTASRQGRNAKSAAVGLLLEIHRALGADFRGELWEVEEVDETRAVYRGPEGARVDARGVWAWVTLPGKACELAGTRSLLRLLGQVGAERVTRIDVALDDGRKRMSPQGFMDELVGHVCAWDVERPPAIVRDVVTRVDRLHGWRFDPRTGTAYVGSTQSARSLRVYDKEAESDGRIRAVRFELQARDAAAKALAADLIRVAERSGKHVHRAMAKHLVGFVDFRDGRGRTRRNTERWGRAGWWSRIVGRVRGARIGKRTPLVGRAWWDHAMRCSRRVVQTTMAVVHGDLVRAFEAMVGDRELDERDLSRIGLLQEVGLPC